MSGDRYPQRLLEPLLIQIAIMESYRIMPRRHFDSPLGTGAADSRFVSRGAGYTVLYSAPEFATAFVETVVRDRLVGRRGREVALKEVTERIWVRLSGRAGQAMMLLDLREDGCVRIRAPTDVVQVRSHAAGRAFGKAIHGEHEYIDGLLYESRLTGKDAYAIFDRGIKKLEAADSGRLHEHPALPALLKHHAIRLVR